ncbi:DUF1254 domain-containing protein [Listeria seeligeri]|uniref:DUF1214 domain-containing protein n=1 Tax=Listeria seeligeri TaxID=1640 RepID=UPI001623BA83|nr:DUF1214 domain-containing protein [Listeria seeligeri]MBC1578014.1 DUF1254 domain-containing protein [Listeria seeligeri]MBC2218536.1 DUF1254 domain-containing protein [Listeria seeligeri]MBC2246237.1 DUF1254 domain-containing protein [Listeria seeligeri]MBF2400690.1 DUF1254 domain-containing protein [Listeria seeligeri]
MSEANKTFTQEDIVNSYVYILGRYLVIRQEKIDLKESGVDYNILKHNPAVTEGSHGDTPTFVNPNLEVVYSEAWLAVDEKTPVILEIPEIPDNLYYTGQIVDEWAEIVTNINERNYPEKPFGKYAICLAGSTPDIPEDALRIDIPSSKAKILTRIEIGDVLELAVKLQHQFKVTSAGTPTITPAIDIALFTNKTLPGAEIFKTAALEEALKATDACPESTVFHPLLRKIATYIEASEADFDEIDKLVHQKAIPEFFAFLLKIGDFANGWSSTRNYLNFGKDYWFRAGANFGGIWWNSSSEAIYNMLHFDADGETPNGSNGYSMRFAKEDLPGKYVDGYWSATIYSKPEYMLVPNELGRYKLGYMSDLAYETDGSIIIYIGAECPSGAPKSNWLPAPKGKAFTIDFRMYLPTKEVLDGTWVVPAIKKIK